MYVSGMLDWARNIYGMGPYDVITLPYVRHSPPKVRNLSCVLLHSLSANRIRHNAINTFACTRARLKNLI